MSVVANNLVGVRFLFKDKTLYVQHVAERRVTPFSKPEYVLRCRDEADPKGPEIVVPVAEAIELPEAPPAEGRLTDC